MVVSEAEEFLVVVAVSYFLVDGFEEAFYFAVGGGAVYFGTDVVYASMFTPTIKLAMLTF